MNKSEKAEAVEKVVELVNKSTALYITDYSGINVEDIKNLRREFKKQGSQYKVIKNTLLKRALVQTGKYEKLEASLVGMTGAVFAGENSVAPAKIIKKFYSDKQKLSLKACYIESQYFDGKLLDQLATLPSKPEIIAGILGSLDAPASGIVGVLNSVLRELVSVVDEIAKQKAA
ncbi:MAG: 50S ribosomal protein L10 [Ignavibacteriaceae bacterium]|jgi:large subunit ribosomal protein L10